MNNDMLFHKVRVFEDGHEELQVFDSRMSDLLPIFTTTAIPRKKFEWVKHPVRENLYVMIRRTKSNSLVVIFTNS